MVISIAFSFRERDTSGVFKTGTGSLRVRISLQILQ
jgi:hypothetical protein